MVGIIKDYRNFEIYRIQNPPKKWIISKLENYICQILFKKELNGRFRSLKCTRQIKQLPVKNVQYQYDIENPHGYTNIIPVWDVENKKWKSFYYQNIVFITVFDPIIKKGKS
jgi:hypothetical protein